MQISRFGDMVTRATRRDANTTPTTTSNCDDYDEVDHSDDKMPLLCQRASL